MHANRCARFAAPALRAARAAVLAALSSAAGAQGAQPGVSLRVDVTGSNIPRSDVESSLPLQVITAEEIARTGVTTTAELMGRVSANVLGFNDALSIGAPFNAGLASISLRGLGDGSTLVLLNGRRVSNYAMSGEAVDVNQIPLAAIERVEILKDGASAIYGSDAIAGVVNFILRKDFTGFELTAFGSWPQRRGGGQWQGQVSAGHGDLTRDGYNVFVMAGYQKDEALDALERSFSRTGYRPSEGLLGLPPTTFPANVVLGRGLAGNPSFANGCAPPASLPTTGAQQTAGNMCSYDVARDTMLLPEVERRTAYGRGTLRIAGAHELFAELGYAENRLTSATSATPVFPPATPDFSRFTYPAGGPFYPTAFAEANGVSGDIDLVFRTVALGRRVTETKSTAWRSVVGAQGTVADWDYATGLTYSHNEQHNAFRSGWVYTSRLQEALASGLVNPFGPSGPAGDALLAATQFIGEANAAEGTTIAFDARASTELAKLPGGALAAAVGMEARREKLEFEFAPPFLAGDILGINLVTHSIAGDRSVQAVFGELIVPFVTGVEAQVAVRYDHYSDFGGTVNPKLALRWQPTRSLLLRTSWGTGFRPPTLYDLNEPRLQTILFRDDPLRCPVTDAFTDCDFVPAVLGGNPDLQPEKSNQFNAGVVWEAMRGLSVALDYWTIGKRNLIGQLPDYLIFENYERFAPTNVVRGPVDPAYPDLPGPIENVVLTWQNLGKVRTSGVDLDVQWKPPATGIGTFAFAFNGTYMLEWKWQPDALSYERAVGKNILGPLPRWRHALSLDWSHAAWGATVVQTFQTGYEDINSFPPRLKPTPDPRRVSSYDVWDLQVRYTGFRNWSIAAGIRNLFDRDPPFTNQPFGPQIGYDARYADPRGRSFYARLGYAFR